VRIFILEPNPDGHRFSYVRRLATAVSELGVEVIVSTTADGVASVQYAEQLRPVESMFTLVVGSIAGRRGPAGRQRRSAEMLSDAIRRHRPDHVYVPYADGTIQIMGARRMVGMHRAPVRCEIEAVMMRGALAYRGRGLRASLWSTAWLAATSAAPVDVIHHLDRIAIDAIRARDPRLGRRMRLLPDPATPCSPVGSAEARTTLGLPQEGRLIGCVGSIDTRKGMDLLVRAFLGRRRAESDRLLLAGPHDGALRDIIAGEASRAVASGRVISIDRYLTEAELGLAIDALDVVAVPYPRDRGHSGSSSILIHAAAHARPVLATDFGWIGATTREIGLGTTCNVSASAEFSQAIGSALDASGAYRPGECARRFVAFSSEANFAEHITLRLRQRMGLATTPPALTWDWVLSGAGDSEHGPRRRGRWLTTNGDGSPPGPWEG